MPKRSLTWRRTTYLRKATAVFAFAGVLLRTFFRHDLADVDNFASFASDPDYSSLHRELFYANRVVKATEHVAKHTQALFLCSSCKAPAPRRTKIVALVEMRNVDRALYGFLRSLEPVVDSIIVLDDHSTDRSRADIFEMCHIRGQRACKVEVMLNKTGPWVREELRDRELLLQMGRRIGGTHFVLLDYDEYFSANCVDSGRLRKQIGMLKPGESLFVPWVEIWKTPHLHRVLPTDRDMNFLTRRQTVIFADDGVVTYSLDSANARVLGAQSGSIHALRCPRTICPRPPKYRGAQTAAVSDPRVKLAAKQCKLIEGRFLYLPNILLKSAWYEGLGRIMGAADSTTRGKMLDVLFPSGREYAAQQQRSSGVALQLTRDEWLTQRNMLDAGASRRVELWRAEELVEWLDSRGDLQFLNLSTAKVIDTSSLRHTVVLSSLLPEEKSMHVPRKKHGTFVVAVEDDFARCASEFLATLGTLVHVDTMSSVRFHGSSELLALHRDLHQGSSFEDWKFQLQNAVRTSIAKSKLDVAYASAYRMSMKDLQSFIDVAINDLFEFDIVLLFSAADHADGIVGRNQAIQAAVAPGSHIRVVTMAPHAYGSYASLSWLRWRLTGTVESTVSERSALLSLAEKFHSAEWKSVIPNSLPVSRVIFSLNVGRSGSKYLASIFSSLGRGIRGIHEPRCPAGKCSGGGAMAMQNLQLSSSYSARKTLKMPMIREAIANISEDGIEGMVSALEGGHNQCRLLMRKDGIGSARTVYEVSSESGCEQWRIRDFVYTETNPNFKSWFYDLALDSLPKSGYSTSVVVLRKYIAAAVKSLYETGYFTSRNGYNWMETANGVNSLIQSIGTEDKLDAYDKLISYIVNAEAVTRKIVKQYGEQGVEFVEMRSEEVYGKDGTMLLLEKLGLHPGMRTMEKAGVPDDKYGNGLKKKKALRTSLETCEQRVTDYLEKCRNMKLPLPEKMEHLKKWPGFSYPG